jgi:hypothetical protein
VMCRGLNRRAPLNAIRVDGDVAYVAVANRSRSFSGEAIVDASEVPALVALGRRWFARWHQTTQQYFAFANATVNGKRACLLLHRVVSGAPADADVDHRNHVMLDCRLENLRACSRQQNLQNRRGAQSNSTSGIRGVSFDKARGLWRAHVTVSRRTIHLGRFGTKEQADAAAIEGRRRWMTHSAECAQAA